MCMDKIKIISKSKNLPPMYPILKKTILRDNCNKTRQTIYKKKIIKNVNNYLQ